MASSSLVAVEELLGAALGQHVVADRRIEPGQRPQLRDPVRVGQEPAVDDEVGVHRQPVLEAEGHHGRLQAPSGRRPEGLLDLGAQLVDVQPGGVDDQVGLAPQVLEQGTLRGDAVDQPAVALQRVRAADALEAADQRRRRWPPGTPPAGRRRGTPAGPGRYAGRRRTSGRARRRRPRSAAPSPG